MNDRSHPPKKWRRVVTVVLAAVAMITGAAMVAFAVDTGRIVAGRAELQVAADVAALAGAGVAVEGPAAATGVAVRFATMHLAAGESICADQVGVRFGSWDKSRRQFTPSDSEKSAIEVTVTSGPRPLFFARLLGKDTCDIQARAVATFAPRDVKLVQ